MFRTEFPLKKHSTRDYLGELKNHSETERLELEGFSNKKDTVPPKLLSWVIFVEIDGLVI